MKKHYFFSIIFFISLLNSILQVNAQKVRIETEAGNIDMMLYAEKAPVTVANFLKYIDEHRFDGTTFYRVVRMDNQPVSKVKIEVIQGGLGTDSTKRLLPIVQEVTEKTGIKHLDGTVSMARSAPNSASSEFFICINDQPELDYKGLRNPDGQGFAAFGKVISGMEVVRKIQNGATGEGEKIQTLKQPVRIVSMKRM